ncbi:recombinase RecA [candidate division WWE3 bacterium RIFOXYB1_FULL_43_24]|uniref:Protein RecA n=1 Tax=candidate division WWE3 bacterium GW2011_GWB1_42_6 TaxID=1619115 RepID=A0A0G1D2T6_UNCKA|nr:MAG: Protein RecA [candidate division WWE3 bacterium GW2011_GWA1_42_12]KKS39863.1 MAG: Protein RecA [candidate division WWE3 bacterium GW2011_GWE1_42_16]KKS65196.1 MAG: Protein RecA [candidate division WWE3 bacterium GW2011_GWB1_42_6]OGC59744.1 MAG: recombinase RecA [candidate division WWE3 bacterium RIFOXYA1_FULL_42_9]OGC69782.1 MAG: recombinase RecA [candidate division WWE3 bacterium RIFOXYB1_FULL_43_24]OGC73740.1 MAG: recombinase RecA [candidate division WWE3 bacterium RIFOXYC1_FULL_42_1
MVKEIKDSKQVETAKKNTAVSQKNIALQTAIDQIEKNYGKGSIMRLGGNNSERAISVIPTGSIALDIALGVGGVPRGRVVEIYGPESSGKTTLVQHIIAEAQKAGGTAALIDAEHAFDPTYAEKTGVDVENLLVSQPDTGEQALEIAETLIRSNAVDVVAIDSVAALVPRAEIEGDIGDSFVATQARLMSQALRRLTGAISRSNCTIIFTNQLRMKIGVMFGNPEITPGGKALKYYASVRIEIRKIESLKVGQDINGIRVVAKVVKNKIAPPFRKAEFDIMFAEGISKESNILDVGVDLNVIKKSGAWYEYNGEKLGQGKEASRIYLKANPKLRDELSDKIKQTVKLSKEIPLELGVVTDEAITEEVE